MSGILIQYELTACGPLCGQPRNEHMQFQVLPNPELACPYEPNADTFPIENSGSGVSAIREEGVVEQMFQARKFRADCFEHADRWFNRRAGWMTALHEGFWLGF